MDPSDPTRSNPNRPDETNDPAADPLPWWMPRPARHVPRPKPLAATARRPACDALVGLRFRRSPRPFGARAPWPVTAVKSTSLARDAVFELREALEDALGERLTQPEVLDLVVAFAARDPDALLAAILAGRAAS